MSEEKFTWRPFFNELVDVLYSYRANKEELSDAVKEALEKSDLPPDIKLPTLFNPFAVLSAINRKSKKSVRVSICEKYKAKLNLLSPVPLDFDGIPTTDPQNWWYISEHSQRGENQGRRSSDDIAKDVERIWSAFCGLYEYIHSEYKDEALFVSLFNRSLTISMIGPVYLSEALFLMSPDQFLPVDDKTCNYLIKNGFKKTLLPGKGKEYGMKYVELLKEVKARPDLGDFCHISFDAWKHEDSGDSVFVERPYNPPLNQIFYGPPGTGKTYNTKKEAVSTILGFEIDSEEKIDQLYKNYYENGQIRFVTFHQSYNYEQFIEGIMPVMDKDSEDEDGETKEIRYDVKPGAFKEFCGNVIPSSSSGYEGISNNPVVWKVSLGGTGDNETRKDCLQNGHIRIGWDEYGENITEETDFSKYMGKYVLKRFINEMKKGDIVFSCYSSTTIDAIGVVVGDYEWHEDLPQYKRQRAVKWLKKYEKEKLNIMDLTNNVPMTLATVYKLKSITKNTVISLLNQKPQSNLGESTKRYVFIIDEINRGNVSRIFGELITLLEESKRAGNKDEVKVKLPYSGDTFSIPNNVYLIGTMNTADRSLVSLDTALRRRFHFREMMPDVSKVSDQLVDGVDVQKLMNTLNERITALYDREHQLGHAYFMHVKTIKDLKDTFITNVIPLLQEYFHDDYTKISMVLSKKMDSNKSEFVDVEYGKNVFTNSYKLAPTYEIQEDNFSKPECYIRMYMSD